MLYKKIHRQLVRECRRGRKFKYGNDVLVYKITKEPYIDGHILIDVITRYNEYPGKKLITTTNKESGWVWLDKDYVTWLN